MRSLPFQRVSLALAALALTIAAPAHADVITFEDLTGSGVLANGYAGITWGGAWLFYDANQPPYTPHSGSERITQSNQTDGVTAVSFSFLTPVVFNGFWASGEPLAAAQVGFNLYDAGNTLVFSSALSAVNATPQFFASAYNSPIVRVEVLNSDNQPSLNGYYVIDDITFTGVTAAPEPGSLALLASLACRSWG